MTAPTGYVKAHRALQVHQLGSKESACERWAWLDLIMLAAWEPHFVKIKNESVLVDRGDLVASVRFLMARWRWGSKKTQRFLAFLSSGQMVSKKRHGSGYGSPSIFSITNYDLYQSTDETEGTVGGTGRGTVGARSGHETKKGKKGKKLASTVGDTAQPPGGEVSLPLNGNRLAAESVRTTFDAFYQVYPKKIDKDDASIVWGRMAPKADLVAAIMAGLEKWKTSEEWLREGGRFIPGPAKWLRRRRWEYIPPAPSGLSPKTSGNLRAAQEFLRHGEQAQGQLGSEP